jgi:hypothetical protein
MSILLVRAGGPVARELVARLIAQDDEVRIVESPSAGEDWSALGAHIARGDDTDPDLIERAAQSVRTAVLFAQGDVDDVVAPLLEGIAAARVGRVVVFADRPREGVFHAVSASVFDHVLMHLPKRRGLFTGRRIPDAAIAEAIDAADDLAGEPRLTLDLGEAKSWAALGLEPPG